MINAIIKELESMRNRSAWERGVNAYAVELVEGLEYLDDVEEICNSRLLEKALLNGASDWTQYSWGGCSLIYNEDIAKRLCNPTELKKTRNGERKPNANEEWLDTQARALYQASRLVERAWITVCEEA